MPRSGLAFRGGNGPCAQAASCGAALIWPGIRHDVFRVENPLGDHVLGVVDQQRALAAEAQIEHDLEEVRPHIMAADDTQAVA